tara:strand:+ start:1987 stop:5106 length:3120 start_codon:yes stop_codon:yes gene_type:complete
MTDHEDQKYGEKDPFGDYGVANPNDVDAITNVLRYKKHLTNHALQHYEMYANSFDKNELTAHSLLYYHVYGDYRLVLEDGGDGKKKARYAYMSPDLSDRDFVNTPVIRRGNRDYFLGPFLENPGKDEINGIYKEVDQSGNLQLEIGEVEWLKEELQREGSGAKFNIPSLGTQVTNLHAYGNMTNQIKDGLVEEMKSLVAFYENKNNSPSYTNGSIQDIVDITGIDEDNIAMDGEVSNVSALFAIMYQQIINNPEYDSTNVTDLRAPNIRREMSELYNSNFDYDDESAAEKFVNILFRGTAGKFDEGDQVTLRLRETNNRERGILERIRDFLINEGYDSSTDVEDVLGMVFVISDKITGDPDSRNNGYRLASDDDVSEGLIDITRSDDADDPDIYMFKDNDLNKLVALDFEEGGEAQSKKSLSPEMLVYQRVVLDTFFAFQSVIHLSEWAAFGNMETTIDRAKAENKMRFLSKGINVKPVINPEQKKDGKTKLMAMNVFHTFPRMTHFSMTRIEGVSPKKDKKLENANFGLLDEMVKWRTYYSLSVLSTIRKKAFDKQILDSFYGSDMLVQEVKWITSTLADGSMTLKKKDTTPDLLAQSQYRDLGETPGVTQFAPSPLETVFYEVDVPLFKMIITEYNKVFNQTVIAQAFNVKADLSITYDSGVEREDVVDVLKEAKELHTRAYAAKDAGDDAEFRRLSAEKSAKVKEAIDLQPSAFIVDQPYGAKDGKPNKKENASQYPGVKYTPTGDRFEFHIGLGSIPRNLPGADNIPNQEALGAPIVDLDNINADPKSKPTKIPDEGKLAKMIWRNARDRIRGIFDIEGVKPYEVMDSLFNQIELDLGKSGALRSPYPDSWLGTDIVTRLRTDPTYLGRPIDRKYYTEKLVEYVDALKSKYLNNWRIPTTLLSTFENAEVTYTKDPDTLKKAFLERLSRDEDRPSLITTNYILRPYQITISIMRAALQINEDDRLQYAADKIDDRMREDIQRHLRSGSALPILPKGHPQRKKINEMKGYEPTDTDSEEEPEEEFEEREGEGGMFG